MSEYDIALCAISEMQSTIERFDVVLATVTRRLAETEVTLARVQRELDELHEQVSDGAWIDEQEQEQEVAAG